MSSVNTVTLVAFLLPTQIYHTGRKFSLEFKFRYFANGKFAQLKSTYYNIFRNLSIIAYMIEIQ